MNCVFCDCTSIHLLSDKRRTYAECSNCKGVFVLKKCFIFPWCQEYRYSLHNNDIRDEGYKKFIQRFIDPVLTYLDHPPKSILDYGSGPSPALLFLLSEYKKNNFLPETTKISGWDPFFNKESLNLLDSKNIALFDLITCLEVAEHFENPFEGFSTMARLLADGGFIAVRTVPVPQGKQFLQWWYINDQTHVSFYTEKAIESIANRVGLQLISVIDECIFILQKPL